MNPRDFQDRLDRHGSAFEAWPANEADLAIALLGRSAEARDMLVRHQAFEAMFQTGDVPEAPPVDLIVARAVAAGREAPRRFSIAWPEGFRLFAWPQMAALAACGLVGFIAGVVEPAYHANADDIYDFSSAADLELFDE